MATPVPQSMPPPQAPSVMGPPQQSGLIASSQAMVSPQYTHNNGGYPQGPPPGMMNGSAVPSSTVGGMASNQPYPGGPVNGTASQPPPNVSVSKFFF